MNADHSEPEKVDEAAVPISSARSNLVVTMVLAVVLGVLLTLGALGAFFHFQQVADFDTKMRALDTAIKDKSETIEHLQGQIEALSEQIHLLRDNAVARSNSDDELTTSVPEPGSLVTEAVAAAKADTAGDQAMSDESDEAGKMAPSRKTSKPKPKAQTCDLVGKSPEEQVEILRRCVSLIDPPEAKARSR